MELNEYKNYVKETINLYPKYMQIDFIRMLSENNLVNTGKRKKVTNSDVIDLTNVSIEQRIERSIDGNQQSVFLFEDMEFNRCYKYSVLFRYNKLYDELKRSIEECENIISLNGAEDFESLDAIPSIAFIKTEATEIMLKFAFKYDRLDPEGNDKNFKYTMIVKIFEDNNLLDIRFDRLSHKLFNDNTEMYSRNIMHIKNWLSHNLGLTLINVDLSSVVDKIKDNEDNVVIYSKSMNSKTGGEAVLKANENYVLPLLGELEKLMFDHAAIFDKSPEIKELLTDFISDIEETSDYPWISLCWKGKTKAKDNIVKFSFDYMKKAYTLMQYVGIQKGMERMDKIVECIATNMENNTTRIESISGTN